MRLISGKYVVNASGMEADAKAGGAEDKTMRPDGLQGRLEHVLEGGGIGGSGRAEEAHEAEQGEDGDLAARDPSHT